MIEAQVAPNATYQSAERVLALLKSFDDTRVEQGVAEVPSTYILSCSGGWTGRRTKPHAVANGKVLLAYGVLPRPAELERYTARTITGFAALDAELAAVRRDGYATAIAELEEGLAAV